MRTPRMKLWPWICFALGTQSTAASRLVLDVQDFFRRQYEAQALNSSSLDMVLSGKKKQEKRDCHAVVAGAEDRTSWHFGSKNCKCPPDHVVAGKSWECGEALGHRHFSSRMAISTCSCEPTSKCEEMVAGAKTRNSASKFADRPCKCENPDEVLDGQAHECSTYLGERYFPNTLPPQECSCQPNVLGSHNCGDIAAGALEVDKDGQAQCECPQEQFINGEDQQCKDFFGARFFPKRLKPGLCSCSANARRPDRPGSGSYRVHLGVAPVLVALAASSEMSDLS